MSGGVRKRPGFEKFIGKEKSLAEIMRKVAIEKGISESKIILEDLCEDTVGELIFLKWGVLLPRKIKNIVIITHDYHFEKVEKECKIIFGDEFDIEYISIQSEDKKRQEWYEKERESFKLFEETFEGIDFFDSENVLNRLLEKHIFYNHSPNFYREELNKMILKNTL